MPYAKQITALQDEYIGILKSIIESTQETLNLGSIHGLAQYKITDVLVNFKKSRPQSTLNVIQGSSRDLKEMLRQRKCEIAFIRDIDDVEEEFVKIPYVTDTIIAVLPITHPLAGRKTIPLSMLKDENFLLEVPNTMPYILSVKACELSGFEPKVVFTDIDRENLIEMVSKGMGVSLILKQILAFYSNPNVTMLDISPNISTQIDLCYPKGVKLSAAAKQFLECAEAQKTLLTLPIG